MKLLTKNTSNLAKALFLLSNDILTVFPCSYSNGGTAIKAAVEYDSVSKTNVGLTCPVGSSFIKENSPPNLQMLYDKILTEAVVGSITTIDNKMSLPVTVDYFPKSGKTGDARIVYATFKNITNVPVMHSESQIRSTNYF